jgi:lysophospholipase L1-like esterase
VPALVLPFVSYVALGDSMSIDAYPGPGLGAASLLYANDDARFPDLAEQDLRTCAPGIAFTNLARDGATTHDVRRIVDETPVPPAPALVTLTVGGNDLLRDVLRLGPRSATDLARRIEALVGHVVARWAPVLLLLATVYDPTDGVGDLWSRGQPHRAALRALEHVNDAIRGLEGRERVVVADVHARFLGHGGHHADPSNPHHDPTDPSCWMTLGIEPNERGGSEVRRSLWAALARAGAA